MWFRFMKHELKVMPMINEGLEPMIEIFGNRSEGFGIRTVNCADSNTNSFKVDRFAENSSADMKRLINSPPDTPCLKITTTNNNYFETISRMFLILTD